MLKLRHCRASWHSRQILLLLPYKKSNILAKTKCDQNFKPRCLDPSVHFSQTFL